MPTWPSSPGSTARSSPVRVSWRRMVRNVPAIYAARYRDRANAGRAGAEHPARRRRRGAAREPQALVRARGPPHHRRARRARGAAARRQRAVRHRAARRRPRPAALRPRRRPPAPRPPRGRADHHADRARQRGRRRPGPGGRRRRLRHQAVRPGRAAQPHPRRPAPRARPRRRGNGQGRPRRARPAHAPGDGRRRPRAADLQRVRAPELPHGAPGQALHPPGAAAGDLGRQRLPRPAGHRRPHPPPAREARGAARAAAADPHRARGGVPLPRAMRWWRRPLGLRLRLLAAMAAVAAATLLAAALALLPSLQDQLRAQAEDGLEAATLSSVSSLERTLRRPSPKEVALGDTVKPRLPGRSELENATFDLAVRVDGRVLVTNLIPSAVYDTQPGTPEPRRVVYRALGTDLFAGEGLRAEQEDTAVVAAPLFRGGKQVGLVVA